MKKMGLLQENDPDTEEAKTAYAQIFDRPLSKKNLAAIRELFPAAGELSDKELTATLQVAGMAS